MELYLCKLATSQTYLTGVAVHWKPVTYHCISVVTNTRICVVYFMTSNVHLILSDTLESVIFRELFVVKHLSYTM